MASVENTRMHRVLQLESGHHGTGGEHVELEAPARHVVDLLGVVDGKLVENVLGRPGRLVFPGYSLRPRHLRHGDRGGAANGGASEEFAPGCGLGHAGSLSIHGHYPPWVSRAFLRPLGAAWVYEPLEQVVYSDKGSLYGVTSRGTRLELSRPPRH